MQLNERQSFRWMFLVILLSSRASVPANSDVVLIFLTLVAGVMFFLRQLRMTSGALLFILSFLVLCGYYFYAFSDFQLFAYTRMLVKILLAFWTIGLVGIHLLSASEKVIHLLALISLPLFAVQLVTPDLFHAANGLLEKILPFLEIGGDQESNSILYNFERVKATFRNSGFAWEPGGFGAFLMIGLMFNLVLYEFRFGSRFMVMFIALLTTLSTTAYLNIFFLFTFWLLNKRRNLIILAAPVGVLMGLFMSQLSFVGLEIREEMESAQHSIINEHLYHTEDFISLGRMGSLIVDYQDFLKHPVLGYGMEIQERQSGFYTSYMRTNGLSDYSTKFGIVGILFLIWSYILFARNYFPRETLGKWLFMVIILLIAFSNPVLDEKFFLCLMLAPLMKIHPYA